MDIKKPQLVKVEAFADFFQSGKLLICCLLIK